MNCPRCGGDSTPTGKRWQYSGREAESYNCPKCKKKFIAYYKNGKLSYTIPKKDN